jgi:uncharacterized UBP type Zn finger protein
MCKHLRALERKRTQPVTPSSRGCKECLETGDGWVHLRLCMTCGHVGCCDESPNHHATRHHVATGHPVIKSFEPGEDWGWCYVDDELVDTMKAFPAESPSEHYAPPDAR